MGTCFCSYGPICFGNVHDHHQDVPMSTWALELDNRAILKGFLWNLPPLHHVIGQVHCLPGEEASGCTMRRRLANEDRVMLLAIFCWEPFGPCIYVDFTMTCRTYLNIVSIHGNLLSNLQDFKDLMLKSWQQIKQHTFRGLIESMSQTGWTVLAAQGGSTQY